MVLPILKVLCLEKLLQGPMPPSLRAFRAPGNSTGAYAVGFVLAHDGRRQPDGQRGLPRDGAPSGESAGAR
jgi:hypothetical protein